MISPDPEAPDWPRVKEIFAEASDLPVNEQAAHVHQAAAGDRAVEREVLRLLRLDAGAVNHIVSRIVLAANVKRLDSLAELIKVLH